MRHLTYRNRFFFFNDTATTEIYTLSLHDALPISVSGRPTSAAWAATASTGAIDTAPSQSRASVTTSRSMRRQAATPSTGKSRSEEHTSELQSPCNLVCRLLLEKKKKKHTPRVTRL